jgi:hypothetical protein
MTGAELAHKTPGTPDRAKQITMNNITDFRINRVITLN